MAGRVGGIIQVSVNGERLRAKGEFTVNEGVPTRTPVNGVDEPHGFMEEVQSPSLEGAITVGPGLTVAQMVRLENATVQVDLADGSSGVYRQAYYSGSGNLKTNEGEFEFKLYAQSFAWLDV